jgi:hypothetical protein
MKGRTGSRIRSSHGYRWLVLTAFTIGLGISLAPTSGAQSVAPGTRVRVLSGDSIIVGHVFPSSPDSIAIGRDLGGRQAFSWSEVDRVDYSVGMKGNAGRGALIGAGVMSLLVIGGAVIESVSGESNDSAFQGDEWGAEVVILVLPFFAALGAGVGAIVGSVIQTERWVILPIASSDGHPGAGLSFSLRW